MGTYVTVLLGLAAIACGVLGLVMTWPLFWTALQVVVPALLVLGGLLAVIVGFGEIRDRFSARRPPASFTPPPSRSS